MSGKPVARIGDRTDHGGTVITGADGIFVENSPVARIGDMVACPKCGGNYPIISGVEHFLGQGKLVAVIGSKTACGATITTGAASCPAGGPLVTTGLMANDAGMMAAQSFGANTADTNRNKDSFPGLLVATNDNLESFRFLTEQQKKQANNKELHEDATTNNNEHSSQSEQKTFVRLLVIIIDNNGLSDDHAAMIIDEGKDALLYDPGGSYSGCYRRPCKDTNNEPIVRGSGDFFIGDGNQFTLTDYISYHLNSQDTVIVGYEFKIPTNQAENIKKQVGFAGGAFGGECASMVSGILKQSGGVFTDLSNIRFRPAGLGSDLKNIKTVKIIQY